MLEDLIHFLTHMYMYTSQHWSVTGHSREGYWGCTFRNTEAMYGASRYTMLQNLDDCFFSSPFPSPYSSSMHSSQSQNISLTPVLWCTHGGDVAHPGAPDLCSAADSVNGTAAPTSKLRRSVHSDRAPHSSPPHSPPFYNPPPPHLTSAIHPIHHSTEDLIVSASSHRQAAQ